MGKSTGFRFAGDGPGMQKKNKLAKKYGQGKNVPARGKMDDLDWGVEQAPKVATDEAKTGLNGLRVPEPAPAAVPKEEKPVAAAKGKRGAAAAATPAKTPSRSSKRNRGAEAEEAEQKDEKAAKRGPIAAAVLNDLGKGAVIPGAAVGATIRLAEKVGASWEANRVGSDADLQWARDEAKRRTAAKMAKKVARC